MAHHQFELASGRRIGVSVLGDPLATRLVVLCLPTPAAGPLDPDPEVTSREPVRLIQIDRPGYGASDMLPKGVNPTVELFADDIAEYLHGIQKIATDISDLEFGPAAVIGWSFGGAVATMLAARHPDLIDRVVLVGSPRPQRIRTGERYSVIGELRKHGVERTFPSLRASLDDDGHPTLIHLGIDDRDPDLTPLGVRGRLDRMLDAGWSQGAAGMATDRIAVRDRRWLDTASAVQQRTLLVYGAQDVVATTRDADWFEHRLRRSTRLTVPDAGHLVLFRAWASILAFVKPDQIATP
jgi:pimeloyl-ACP methyl ester carboxylesterase